MRGFCGTFRDGTRRRVCERDCRLAAIVGIDPIESLMANPTARIAARRMARKPNAPCLINMCELGQLTSELDWLPAFNLSELHIHENRQKNDEK